MTDYSDLDAAHLIQGVEDTTKLLTDYTKALKALALQPLDPNVRSLYGESLAKCRVQIETDLGDLEDALRKKSTE